MFYLNFIDVNIVSNQFTLAKPLENAKEIVRIINDSNACFNLFPELSLTGYTLGNTIFEDSLFTEIDQALKYILDNTKTNAINIIGLPIKLDKIIYNCAIFLQKNHILGLVPKSFIPNYKEFSEGKYYLSGLYNKEDYIYILGQKVPFGFLLFNDKANNVKFCVEICEDMWVKLSPSTYYANMGADIIFNMSATTTYVTKQNIRNDLLKDISRRNSVAYIYASSGLNEKLTNALFQNCLVAYCCGKELFKEYTYTKDTIAKLVGIDLNKIHYDKVLVSHEFPEEYFTNEVFNIREINVNLEKTDHYDFHQSIFEPTRDFNEIFKMYQILIENKFQKEETLLVRRNNALTIDLIKKLHTNIEFCDDPNQKAINLMCQSDILRAKELNQNDYYIFGNLQIQDMISDLYIDDFVIYRIFECHDNKEQIQYLLNYLGYKDYDLDGFIKQIKNNIPTINQLDVGIRIHDYSILDNKDLNI